MNPLACYRARLQLADKNLCKSRAAIYHLLGAINCLPSTSISASSRMSRLRFLLVHWALIAALVETQQMVEVVRTLVDEVVDTKKILPTLTNQDLEGLE